MFYIDSLLNRFPKSGFHTLSLSMCAITRKVVNLFLHLIPVLNNEHTGGRTVAIR